MIVDNGRRVPLAIDGVFEGEAGVSRGVLAFTRNRFARPPEQARGGVLDGRPILLGPVTVGADGFFCTATYREL